MCDSHHVLEPLPLNQSLSLDPPQHRFWSNNKIAPNSENRETSTLIFGASSAMSAFGGKAERIYEYTP